MNERTKLGGYMKFKKSAAVFALLVGHVANAHTVFESRAEAVPTLELFSSEGCSSCPPADQWFAALKSAPGLWKDFIPVVFHVDYWDQLGWKDELASPAYTDRQRAYASEWATEQIYTPEVVYAGSEWTGWRSSQVPEHKEGKVVGKIKLEQLKKGKFAVSFAPSGQALSHPIISIAILGVGVRHAIAAGENRGTTLSHDFVVLQFQSQAATNDKGVLRATFELKDGNVNADRLAAAAWVSANGKLRAVQAVGGFIER